MIYEGEDEAIKPEPESRGPISLSNFIIVVAIFSLGSFILGSQLTHLKYKTETLIEVPQEQDQDSYLPFDHNHPEMDSEPPESYEFNFDFKNDVPELDIPEGTYICPHKKEGIET